MMPRSYKIATLVCAALALTAATLGPIVAIRVLESSDASRQRASDRITSMQKQLTGLEKALQVSIEDRASLHQDVDVLSTQIRQLGGTPVVMPPTTSTTSPPATVLPPATTTTTRKPTGVTLPVSVPPLG